MTHVPVIPRAGTVAELRYRTVLRPHRSLNRRGFLILMAAMGAVSFGVGMVFLMLGAWPVLGFFGLDLLLIHWAFRINYAQMRTHESLELYPDELVIRRVERGVGTGEWRLHPYWVRLELETDEGLETCGPLWLTSHGKRLRLGAFLGPEQLRALAGELQAALARVR